MPPRTSASASPTFCTHWPTAPCAICLSAIAGDLWVLACGRSRTPAVRDANLSHRLRIAMLANGVDIMGAPGGLVSASHGPSEVARTLDAFRVSVRWLKDEGDIAA